MIVITNIILFKEFDNKMRESIIKFYIFNTLELVLYDVNVYIKAEEIILNSSSCGYNKL